MSFTLSDQQDFTQLIADFGQQYTFTHIEPGAYNPATGTTSGDVTTTYTTYCVRDSFSNMDRQNSDIEQSDIKLIAEWADYQLDDTVSINGENYRIINPAKVIPGDTGMIFELQVRK